MAAILHLQKLQATATQQDEAAEWSTFSNCCHGSNQSMSDCCS